MTPKKQTMSPNEKLIPLMTRLPESLHAKIRELAEQEHRSLNAQVVYMLLQQLKDDAPDD